MTTGTPQRAPDASMSLLRDVSAFSLDPGYRRAKEAERAGGSRSGPAGTGIVVLVGVLLGCLTVWAIRELRVPPPVAAESRQVIIDRIDLGTHRVKDLQVKSEELRAEIAGLQRAVVDVPVADRIDALALAAGESAVRGPGLRLTMRDAPKSARDNVATDPREATDVAESRVLDRDLQIVVNALWAAGAEAISINGERLSALSAIRGAGDAVLVDFKPLVPPYEVLAVGDAAGMQAGFAANGGGDYVHQLRDLYGIETSLAAVDELDLPAAGQPALQWVRTATPETSEGQAGEQPTTSEENP